MRVATRTRMVLVMASALLISACSEGSIDPTVVFHHEPTPAQPWTATGELVDAGRICPSGDRQNISLAHLDGTPMTLQELVAMIDAAEATGGSHWDVPRVGEMQYVCNDGSGTFTLLEVVDEDSRPQMTGDISSGTGAYVTMTGNCVLDLTENEAGTEITDMVGTCEFDMGSAE